MITLLNVIKCRQICVCSGHPVGSDDNKTFLKFHINYACAFRQDMKFSCCFESEEKRVKANFSGPSDPTVLGIIYAKLVTHI